MWTQNLWILFSDHWLFQIVRNGSSWRQKNVDGWPERELRTFQPSLQKFQNSRQLEGKTGFNVSSFIHLFVSSISNKHVLFSVGWCWPSRWEGHERADVHFIQVIQKISCLRQAHLQVCDNMLWLILIVTIRLILHGKQ